MVIFLTFWHPPHWPLFRVPNAGDQARRDTDLHSNDSPKGATRASAEPSQSRRRTKVGDSTDSNASAREWSAAAPSFPHASVRLGDEGGGGGGLVLEVGGDLLGGLVVPGESVDSGLDENESELGVLVLPALLEMLSDVDGLLDEEVEVLWDLWGESVSLEDSQNLAGGDGSDLGDTVGVTQDDTNLGGCVSLLGELADVLGDLGGGDLEPGWRGPLVGESAGAHSLSLAVHATHGGLVLVSGEFTLPFSEAPSLRSGR